jgi:hypothetical protein
MRTMSALFALILLAFSVPQAGPTAFAQEACRCKGCGCKGGPGWRGPEGTCVSQAKLAEICGSPPSTPCSQEAATRVCFTGETASVEPKAKTEAQ